MHHFVDIDGAFDQAGFAGGEGLLESGLKVSDVADAVAVNIIGLGQLDKVRAAIQRGLGIVFVVHQRLPLADHAEGLVVEQYCDNGQAVVLHSSQFIAVHTE